MKKIVIKSVVPKSFHLAYLILTACLLTAGVVAIGVFIATGETQFLRHVGTGFTLLLTYWALVLGFYNVKDDTQEAENK